MRRSFCPHLYHSCLVWFNTSNRLFEANTVQYLKDKAGSYYIKLVVLQNVESIAYFLELIFYIKHSAIFERLKLAHIMLGLW